MAVKDMNAWKKQNYNRSIRVSNQTIDQLRAGKTFAGNVAKFKKTGMTAVEREAMNRFYGKARTSAAFGNSVLKNPNTGVSTPVAKTSRISSPAPRIAAARANDWSSTVNKPTKQTPKTTTYKTPSNTTKSATTKTNKSFWSKAGGFVANELLGIDDFKRTANYVSKGQWGKAAKSVGTGLTEFGTTAAAVAAAIPTGGGSLGARALLVGARQASKTGAKAAAKYATKKTARAAQRKAVGTGLKGAGKAVIKNPVRTAARGSIPTGIKGAAKTARYVSGVTVHAGMQTVRSSKSVVGKAASKVIPTLERKAASKVSSSRKSLNAVNAARSAEAKASKDLAEARASKAGSAAIRSAQSAKGKATYARAAAERAYKARAYRKPAVRAKAGVLAAQGIDKARQKGKKK